MISVIIPVYNGEKWLRQTLDSVLHQAYRDLEIVCVDDGSTDGSLAILEEYAARDPRVAVHRKPNGGLPAISLNFGLSRSRGEYVFPLGHDDHLHEDTLGNLYERAVSSSAQAAIPDLVFFDGDEVVRHSIVGLRGNRGVVMTGREAVAASLDWTIHAFALWDGNLVRRIKYDESGMNSDEYSARVFFLNCNRVVFAEGKYFYRQHSGSVTKRVSLRRFDVLNTNRLLLELVEGNDFPDAVVDRMRLLDLEGVVKCCLLIGSGRQGFSPEELKSATSKVRSAYHRLGRWNLARALAHAGGGRNYLKVVAYLSGYQVLRAACAARRFRAARSGRPIG